MLPPTPLPNAATLHPAPSEAGRCPRDGAPLAVARLHLAGWRFACEGTCPACGHLLVQDLPTGHALTYPTTLDLDTGETLDASAARWFSSRFEDAWRHPDHAPVDLQVERQAAGGRALLLHCLDPVYGHALLRLLNAERVAGAAAGAATIVLVPRALAPLVPDSVTERWIVDEPLGRLWGWLTDLDRRLHEELARFDEVALVAAPPHPHPQTYDLDRIAPDVGPEHHGRPTVALSLRDDRRWGADAADQATRVEVLVDRVRRSHPDAGFVAVGPGPPGGLPQAVTDLRAARPAAEDERRWIGVLRGARLAIGVHGSNMLLPSGLAEATIELLPRERYGNRLQASLVRQDDPLVALDRHRTVYGDEDLADVSGDRVAEIAIAVLDGMDRFVALSTGPAAGIGAFDPLQAFSAPLPASPERPREEAGRPARPAAVGRVREAAVVAASAVGIRRAAPDPADTLAARLEEHLATLPAGAVRRVHGAAGRDAALPDPGPVEVVVLEALVDPPGATPPPSRAVLARLEAAGLRPYAGVGGRLLPFRPGGPLREPQTVVALGAAAHDRLAAAGLIGRGGTAPGA